jgi:lysophospholipase L1-like esterase
MKKIVIVFILIFVFSNYTYAEVALVEKCTFCYNLTKVFLKRQDNLAPTGSVVLIGDSHIQGLCTTAINHSLNLGLGGESTRRLLLRIPQYRSLKTASKIIVWVGTNDILNDVPREAIIHNLKNILNALPKNTKVFMIAVLPFGEGKSSKEYNQIIRQINSSLDSYCSQLPSRFFIKNSFLTDNKTKCLSEKYHTDSIHLNESGYRFFLQVLKKQLNQ